MQTEVITAKFIDGDKRKHIETPQAIIDASKEYEEIWLRDGIKIINALERLTGLTFPESEFPIAITETSRTYAGTKGRPMLLSSEHENKEAVLMHELGHRILFDNEHVDPKINQEKNYQPIREALRRLLLGKNYVPKAKNGEKLHPHRLLDLFLYDAWTIVYGLEKANEFLELEKEYGGDVKIDGEFTYKEAWEWVFFNFPTWEARQLVLRNALGTQNNNPLLRRNSTDD